MSLENTWRLLERQNIVEQHTSILFVNPPADLTVDAPHSAWHVYGHSSVFLVNGDEKPQHSVTAYFNYSSPCEAVIVFLPKEKSLADFLFLQLASQLPINTPMYVVGPNDGGIRALLKKNIPGFEALHKHSSGSHCQLLQTVLLETQLFSAELFLNNVALTIQQKPYDICFLPGVFGEKRLDSGTAFLLEHVPPKISGSVLDFGCGSGVISTWLCSQRKVSKLMAADLSTLATTATEHTLANCDVPHEVRLSDGFKNITERFNWIITNPPFHQGKRTDYRITSEFIKTLKNHLHPGGHVLMVANTFLPWPSLLQEEFKRVDTLAQNSRYTVTLAR